MNVMTHTLERKPAESASIADIAEMTAGSCVATRVRQLSRIVTRVYDDAMRPLGITASQYTRLAQLAARDAITAVEIGHELDIEKSTLSRNLKRLLALGHINMDPPAGRRGRGLHLTGKGQTVLKDAFPIWQDAQKRTVSAMGAESRNMLDSLLHEAEKLAPI
ncbi:MAG: MarR family winged helix-turn-helix transcriptional regulator [Hyphomicrobium sp.]